jgi:chaperone BCS1
MESILALPAASKVVDLSFGYLKRKWNDQYCRFQIWRKDKPDLYEAIISSVSRFGSPNVTIHGSLEDHLFVCGFGKSSFTYVDPSNSTSLKVTVERKKIENGHEVLTLQTHRKSIMQLKQMINSFIMEFNESMSDKVVVKTPEGVEWVISAKKARRCPSTLALPNETWQSLLRDVDTFFDENTPAEYKRTGRPYRRGYLFYGQPGTGKTTTAVVLASHFKLPIYYLQLGSIASDQILASLLRKVPKRSIILIEDIDVAQNNRESDSSDYHGRVTLSGLLNSLDGVAAYEGSIIICTTNYVDKLDPALKRPGRLDMHIEYTFIAFEQAVQLWRIYFDSEKLNEFKELMSPTLATHQITPADLQNELIANSADIALRNIGIRWPLEKETPVRKRRRLFNVIPIPFPIF